MGLAGRCAPEGDPARNSLPLIMKLKNECLRGIRFPTARSVHRWAAALILTTAVTASLPQATAADNLVMSVFPDEESAGAWSRWWGAAPQLYEFDGQVNAGPDTDTGSLKATIEFDLAAYGGDNQFALQGALTEPINAALYTNLVFEVMWDPNSPKRPSGDFGNLEYGLRNADFSQTQLGSLNIPGDTTGWLRIGAPIAASLPKLQDVTGIYLKMWSGDPASGQTGTAVFWLDNVIFQADQRTTPPPPPTLSIQPAKAGLQMFASAGGAQYQRQNIRTVESGYSWVGRPGPVNYVLTLGSYPDSTHSGFQSHIFLVPSETPPTESSPDWNQPNVVFLDIGNNNSGGAYATLRYKTNQPSGNSMYYNSNPDNGPVGVLTSVNSATPVGAWSLGFDGANVTLTAPDGTSSTVEFPAASAALFADPLYAFFGVQPNQLANIGQSALFTRVQISGVATPLDDNFAGVPADEGDGVQLDPAVWQVVAQDPNGVVLVPQGSTWWTWWTLPAAGYSLQGNSSLQGGTWEPVAGTPIRVGAQQGLLLPPANPPDVNSAFYRLLNPDL